MFIFCVAVSYFWGEGFHLPWERVGSRNSRSLSVIFIYLGLGFSSEVRSGGVLSVLFLVL